MKTWCNENGLVLNAEKTKSMFVSKKGKKASSDCTGLLSSEMKFLGVIFNQECNWKSHVLHLARVTSKLTYILRELKQFLPKQLLIRIYYAIIRSRLEYSNAVFVGMSKGEASKLERIQRRCHKIICGKNCTCNAFPPLEIRRLNKALHMFQEMRNPHNIIHHLAPPMLPHGKRLTLFPSKSQRRLNTFIPFCTQYMNAKSL